MEIEARDAGDPILFHATRSDNAENIMKVGPITAVRTIDDDRFDFETGLYFGTMSSAFKMANMVLSGVPSMLAVRASALERLGEILPDTNILECGACRGGQRIWADREDPDVPEVPDHEFSDWSWLKHFDGMTWRKSLDTFGAVACVLSEPVPEMLNFRICDEDCDRPYQALLEGERCEMEP